MNESTPIKNMIKGANILLASGQYFNYLDPGRLPISIEDIAYALSNTCRFGGHCPFYSVAEHSYLASLLVPMEYAYEALMHDAAEAFVGDVPKPLKNLLPDFIMMEARVEEAIARQFDLPFTMSAEVKSADLSMLALEQRVLFNNYDNWGTTVQALPVDIKIHRWKPEQARLMFLARYHELRED